MERTGDFRQLTRRFSGGAALPPPAKVPRCAFIRAAEDQKRRLDELRHSLHCEGDHAAAIRDFQHQMKDLEGLVEDNSDLAVPTPWRPRDHVAHRRSLLAALYEDLKEIASRVQATSMSEQRRAAEVAGYFTAVPRSSSAALLKPPPPPPPTAIEGSFRGGTEDEPGSGTAVTEHLHEEEQALLAAYETDLDKIVETQAKIGEVANLVSLVSTKVVEQQEQIDAIHELAEESTALVESAGKHLDRAVQNNNSYRFYVVCWFVGSAMALLAFDFIDERYSWI